MLSSQLGVKAAQIARDAAMSQQGNFAALSSKMCWDAVVHCQVAAGGPDPGSITTDHSSNAVSTSDPAICTASDMYHVPQGAFIGFFRNHTLIHAMIATGFGFAAGNKNACIGVGSPVGWELLDLAGRLPWMSGGIMVGPQHITVHYRAMP